MGDESRKAEDLQIRVFFEPSEHIQVDATEKTVCGTVTANVRDVVTAVC